LSGMLAVALRHVNSASGRVQIHFSGKRVNQDLA